MQGPRGFPAAWGTRLAWVGLEVLGIATFAAGALLLGWLILPALETSRLTLVVIVAAIAKVRLVLTLVRFIISPYRPALRLAPMPDRDAKLVWVWALAATAVIAAAAGIRDVLISSGTTRESAALLGILVVAFAALVRLVAIYRIRKPIHDLILLSYAGKGGKASGAVELSANLWHIAFSVLVLVNFVGAVYSGLLSDEVRYASLAIGPFLVLSLVPFAVSGYGALIDDPTPVSGGGWSILGRSRSTPGLRTRINPPRRLHFSCSRLGCGSLRRRRGRPPLSARGLRSSR